MKRCFSILFLLPLALVSCHKANSFIENGRVSDGLRGPVESVLIYNYPVVNQNGCLCKGHFVVDTVIDGCYIGYSQYWKYTPSGDLACRMYGDSANNVSWAIEMEPLKIPNTDFSNRTIYEGLWEKII